MNGARDRIALLGVELPEAWTMPPGVDVAFDMVVVSHGQAFVAGHGPVDGSRILMEGVIGEELTTEQGYESARLAAMSILASLERELGDLDRVTRWLRAVVYINCVPGVPGPTLTKVGDGFSDLIRKVWGDAGRHTRVSPGVNALPFNIPTIVEAVLEVT
jgi:enamine deaminase RidA (YjgF/YER057c/UK114 family)